ncbi:MAG: O-antigen ligase family protein, partial [Myxococcota bacterium]|nr:O-antigen ligase family protein [Myxococcota bacterium]
APWALLCVAALLSLVNAADPLEGAHFVLRKVLFPGIAFGVGLAGLVSGRIPPRTTRKLLVMGLGLTAAVSVVTSTGRLLAGNALWWSRIEGLTPNHKTLAVALAGSLPLALGIATGPAGRVRTAARAVGALAVVAIGMSMSKAAWLGAGVGIAWFVPRRRPLAARPGVLAPALALALMILASLPLVTGSRAMLDSARSRHSLNIRAWKLFRAHPMLGSGAGASTTFEAVTFPDYRVNGVDAHGVIQKVGGELGVFGLGTWFWFTGAVGVGLWRRREPMGAGLAWGALGTFTTLHVELLLSTETFAPTHWAPLAVAWGLAHATEESS